MIDWLWIKIANLSLNGKEWTYLWAVAIVCATWLLLLGLLLLLALCLLQGLVIVDLVVLRGGHRLPFRANWRWCILVDLVKAGWDTETGGLLLLQIFIDGTNWGVFWSWGHVVSKLGFEGSCCHHRYSIIVHFRQICWLLLKCHVFLIPLCLVVRVLRECILLVRIYSLRVLLSQYR